LIRLPFVIKLLEYFKKTLGNLVKDVKISKKLTSSIACLTVGDSGMDIHMERLLMEQNKLHVRSTKILELNPTHQIIEKIIDNLKLRNSTSDDNDEELVKLIFDQACIVGGDAVSDVGAFAQRLNDILYKVLSGDLPEKTLTQQSKLKVKKPQSVR